MKNLGCKTCLKKQENTSNFLIKLQKLNFTCLDINSYLNSKSEVNVKCNIHENVILKSNRNTLLMGSITCPECRSIKQKLKSKNNFIKKSQKIHHDYYDYSKVCYTTCMEKVEIICPNHGIFTQTPDAHLRGQKCPKCVLSYKENYIKNVLENMGIEYVFNKGHKLLINPETNYPLRPDFFIEELNLIIEYDGISHFKSIYNEEEFLKRKKLDILKNNLCKLYDIQIWRFNKNNLHLLESKLIKKQKIN